MADITPELDPEREFLRLVVKGDLHPGEMSQFSEEHQHLRTRLVLWDLEQASWNVISATHLIQLLDTAKRLDLPGYKTAFLFSRDVDFGMGRVVENYTEASEFETNYRSFRDRDEAERWLFTD